MRARSAQLIGLLLAACLLLPLIGGAMFALAVRQRVIAPANIHLDLVLVRIDAVHIYLQRCSAPAWYCMPQDDHEADQDIYTVRVSVYTSPRGKPIFMRQVMAVQVQPQRRR